MALYSTREVIQSSANFLMSKNNKNFTADEVFYLDDVRINNDGESRIKYKEALHLTKSESEKKVVLFNPNLNKRDEIISFRVNSPNLEVLNSKGELVAYTQVSLVWKNTDGGYLDDNNSNSAENDTFGLNMNETVYELLFEAHFDALSLHTFTIRLTTETKQTLTKVDIYAKYYTSSAQQELHDLISKR